MDCAYMVIRQIPYLAFAPRPEISITRELSE